MTVTGLHRLPAGLEPPASFRDALADLRSARPRPQVRLRLIPEPAGLAPFAVALAADVRPTPDDAGPAAPAGVAEGPEPAGAGVVGAGAALATGRFMLLHDPAGSAAWNGTFRVVTYIRAGLEPDVATDHLAGAVAWAWLVEALEQRHAQHFDAGGTATRQLAESFGALAGEPAWTDLELRASWTPAPRDLGAHLEAWSDMICAFAGLPPDPPGGP
ncbi:DUF3000 domain-containing protein [Micrococcus sp.]|uniref:DUF3000 domain-containing protein n=1 Tax=Micrococcus sp. TaxID=1271 RepID=UPI002A912ADF|nr:DUF3000 domain-containing protein [Micrococcus sp.]MDY6055497.1 DUF3000 domain-containing protein [Micrococcus sp.]